MKRILSVSLILFMLIPTMLIFNLSASAASGSCGEDLTWSFSDTTLTISGKGAMYDYSDRENVPWYDIKDDIELVIIENGVTSIGSYSFFLYSFLTSVDIPDSVTSIGFCAFTGCERLKNITIPDNMISIDDGAFSGCGSLTSVTIPNSMTSISDYAFDWCVCLKTITIPDSVTSIGSNSFDTCIQLTSVTIPKSVTSIGADAFRNCHDLKIMCYEGSYAEQYAQANSIPFEYIFEVVDQELVAYGLSLTVKNLDGVKDFFIAKGEYTTYADVKANRVVLITKNKIGTDSDYTYILPEPGVYTVCVRYDDTTKAHKFMTVELTVTEPVFTENGLQLNIANLDDIKVIRTAYGDYNTPGEIKRAEGARAFTAKGVLKGLEKYVVQYREEGLVSVAVVYNNGYEVIYKYNVTKKAPVMTQEGNRVTFTKLDGLKVLRYAEGVYTTSNQIKNAAGSVALSNKFVTENSVTVSLESGIYTFCVQYDDESYNYYNIAVE
ncbi:MAG: leucine-rich repeat domain-containing protein [Clostridia bacterium]|nr:leucine-rich repeat domain-containing protein [Clostridia bacterium]